MRRHAPLAAALAALALLVTAAACKTSHEPECPAGQVKCGLACVDTATSALHCGGCGQACGLGTCSGGACQCDTAGGANACPPGHFPRCADQQHDAANCGEACVTCKPGAACDLGTCACPAGTTDCPAGCFDTQTDARNCGGCGIACLPGETCKLGGCTCEAPRTSCPGKGCFDILTDRDHCGTTCDALRACPATATCVAGACACPAGKTECNGACVDTQTDPNNCNGCGNRCAAGGVCSGGTCSCPASAPTVCGSAPGTCVDTLSDEANCNGCGLACGAGQTCTSGACCAAGQSQVCGSGAAKVCCAGNLCCGSACGVAHDNGLGQAYFSCDPVGTLTRNAALQAAQAWAPAGGTVVESGLLCASCLCLQTTTAAATWCYDGPLAGQVSRNDLSVACLCPPGGSFSGPWN